MNDHDAFLRTICENPLDDAPRLIYADWLEERGEGERAEFIRCQIELARMDEEGWGFDPEYGHTCHEDPCPVCVSIDRREALGRRERELLYCQGWKQLVGIDGLNESLEKVEYGPTLRNHQGMDLTFGRGFAQQVRCRLADWTKHGSQIVLVHPVLLTALTDRVPYYNAAACWLWLPANQALVASGLPEPIYAFLPDGIDIRNRTAWRTFRSREGAIAALSHACINWARSQVTPKLNPISTAILATGTSLRVG